MEKTILEMNQAFPEKWANHEKNDIEKRAE